MKKLFALLVVAGMCFACTPKTTEPEAVEEETAMEQVDETTVDQNADVNAETAEAVAE